MLVLKDLFFNRYRSLKPIWGSACLVVCLSCTSGGTASLQNTGEETTNANLSTATPITPQSASGKCLEATSSNTANGTAVQMATCNGSDGQNWAYTNGMLQLFGNKCLDVIDGVAANGTLLQIYDCSSTNVNQQWTHTGNTFVWKNTYCLDLTNGGSADGTRPQIYTCGPANNINQQWNFGSVSAPLQNILSSNVCLDSTGGSTTNGTAVQLTTCNGGTSQNWAYQNGSIVVGGNKCLDVPGGSKTNGQKLQIWDCATGNVNQQWKISNNKILFQDTMCLDVSNGHAANGQVMQIWGCGSTKNQEYTWGSNIASTSTTTSTTSPTIPAGQAEVWLTSGDMQTTLQLQPRFTVGGAASSQAASIVVDTTAHLQPYLGVGAGMPESSAYVITKLTSAATRQNLVQALFDPSTGGGLSFLRIPMGASDFSHVGNYSYDDSSADDTTLTNFSLSYDLNTVVPVAQQAKKANSNLQLILTPWSPPAWMKTTPTLVGASNSTLKAGMMPVLAQYFVRAIQSYQNLGLPIWGISPQNEPQYVTTGYPSMLLSPSDEANFISSYLAPALSRASLNTLILGFDHNYCDDSQNCPNPYATTLLSQTTAGSLGGIAWHCYEGDPSAMGTFHSAHSDVPIFQTECASGPWNSSTNSPSDYFAATRSLVFDSVRNGSQSTMYWPLALDNNAGPQNGGCSNCRGLAVVSSDGSGYSLNPEYYSLAHVGRFVRPGAIHVQATDTINGVRSIAFLNTDKTVLLYSYNQNSAPQAITVTSGQTTLNYTIPANATISLRWNQP